MLALSKMLNRNKLSNSRSDTGSDGKRLCISNYAIHVSIHAPVRGATAAHSRHHRALCVSIHAPVRGATTADMPVAPSMYGFNSRSRAGSDVNTMFFRKVKTVFQFTLPCGERPSRSTIPTLLQVFQFTLPCGERRTVLLSVFCLMMFQFTLPCGERRLQG